MLWQFVTQGVASLALGYVLLPFQGVHSWLQNHAEKKTRILNTLPVRGNPFNHAPYHQKNPDD